MNSFTGIFQRFYLDFKNVILWPPSSPMFLLKLPPSPPPPNPIKFWRTLPCFQSLWETLFLELKYTFIYETTHATVTQSLIPITRRRVHARHTLQLFLNFIYTILRKRSTQAFILLNKNVAPHNNVSNKLS